MDRPIPPELVEGEQLGKEEGKGRGCEMMVGTGEDSVDSPEEMELSAKGKADLQQEGQHQPSSELCRLAYSVTRIPRHLQWYHGLYGIYTTEGRMITEHSMLINCYLAFLLNSIHLEE